MLPRHAAGQQHLRLAVESCHESLLAGQFRGQDLDRHGSVQRQLTRPKDHPHRPSTDLIEQLESRDLDLPQAGPPGRRELGQVGFVCGPARHQFGPNTRPLLAERGYRIDSSVRARYDYRADGGPDFRAVGNAAYRVDGLVELPFTTVYAGALRRQGGAGYDLLGRVSLTPEEMPVADALQAIEVAVAAGERLLILSFHSPSLEPGHTPYVRNADDLAQFWAWWEAVFARLDRLGVRAAGLDEVIAASGA